MPAANMGEKGKETVKTAGTVKRYFKGQLNHWKSFQDEVLTFWTDDQTVDALGRCDHLPVGVDHSTVGELNPYAMYFGERIQCGGEITISGRFYSNALEHVVRCVETLGQHAGFGPKEVVFGDSWIQYVSDRVPGQQPDILGQFRVGKNKHEVRLLGEVKFPLTVDIADMVKLVLEGDTKQFCEILGQVVNYMLGHRLKYAFLTNYRETTFLMLHHIRTGHGTLESRIAFSNPIMFDDTVNIHQKRISVRLALLYLIHKTGNNTNKKSKNKDDENHSWQISELACKVTEKWI
ncbi:hypothetical protein C7974DRAFT_296915, partial [Boeremia exigua]|uniref:uncharacterized protein n=1 Tax=Boeremia exigua TaxID=749465 RepID=UPI001E8E4B52